MRSRSWKSKLLTAVLSAMVLIGTMGTSLHALAATSVEAANIRATASTDANLLGVLYPGTEATVIGEVIGTDGELWYHIEVDAGNGITINGYVKGTLLTGVDEEVPEEEEAEGGYVQGPEEPAQTQEPVQEEPAAQPEEPAQQTPAEVTAPVPEDFDPLTDPAAHYEMRYRENGDGTGTWYAYNTETGREFELGDGTVQETVQPEAPKAAGSGWRTAAILFGILALALLGILLFLMSRINEGRRSSRANRLSRRAERELPEEDEEDSEDYEEEEEEDAEEDSEEEESEEDDYYKVDYAAEKKVLDQQAESAGAEPEEAEISEGEEPAEEEAAEEESVKEAAPAEEDLEEDEEQEPEDLEEDLPDELDEDEEIPAEEEVPEEEDENSEEEELEEEQEDLEEEEEDLEEDEEDLEEEDEDLSEEEEVFEEDDEDLDEEEDDEDMESALFDRSRSGRGKKTGAAAGGALGAIGGFLKKIFAADPEDEEEDDDFPEYDEDGEYDEEDDSDEDYDEEDGEEEYYRRPSAIADGEFADGDPDDYRIFDDHSAGRRRKRAVPEFRSEEEEFEDELRNYPEDADLLPKRDIDAAEPAEPEEDPWEEEKEPAAEEPAEEETRPGLSMQKVMRNVHVREDDDFIAEDGFDDDLTQEDLESVLFDDDDDDMEYSFLRPRRK